MTIAEGEMSLAELVTMANFANLVGNRQAKNAALRNLLSEYGIVLTFKRDTKQGGELPTC